ncbi:unnamed protein product [Pleuronectes platessa]|uniref:Uncharacterized protein n=1 Tax=Pleuronectes platessa TaxID=8262 RepID=A0A9N7USS6_PLEPL|nr:unnamed protein product [Pleuronectes platessa]
MGCLGNSKTEDQRIDEKAQREANKKIEKQLQKERQALSKASNTGSRRARDQTDDRRLQDKMSSRAGGKCIWKRAPHTRDAPHPAKSNWLYNTPPGGARERRRKTPCEADEDPTRQNGRSNAESSDERNSQERPPARYVQCEHTRLRRTLVSRCSDVNRPSLCVEEAARTLNRGQGGLMAPRHDRHSPRVNCGFSPRPTAVACWAQSSECKAAKYSALSSLSFLLFSWTCPDHGWYLPPRRGRHASYLLSGTLFHFIITISRICPRMPITLSLFPSLHRLPEWGERKVVIDTSLIGMKFGLMPAHRAQGHCHGPTFDSFTTPWIYFERDSTQYMSEHRAYRMRKDNEGSCRFNAQPPPKHRKLKRQLDKTYRPMPHIMYRARVQNPLPQPHTSKRKHARENETSTKCQDIRKNVKDAPRVLIRRTSTAL